MFFSICISFLMKNLLSVLFWLIITFSLLLFPSALFAQKDASKVGINYSNNCLTWFWKGCFEYEKAVWIDTSQKTTYSAMSIVQDVIFAATYILWSVLTLVILYCGLMYIFAARWWKDTSAYRKWLINAAIWAILVWWAYALVRLIQYVARW